MLINLFLTMNVPFIGWLILLIIFLIIDIVAIIHILKNKHDQPVSALLWIFLVIELHIFGVIIYLILGINRIHTTGLKIEKSHKTMHAVRNSSGSLSRYLAEIREFHYVGNTTNEHNYLSVLDRILPSTYPICGNKLELLEDGTAAYPKMFEAIQKAKDHIHLQSYIIMNDETGERLFNVLEEKARSGVKVKVLFDRMGSGRAYKARFFKHWAREIPNFEIKPFN